MNDISILCITRADDYALPFLDDMSELAGDLSAALYVAADGDRALARLDGLEGATGFVVRSHGYLESVLDTAVAQCEDGYILRLDDDERVSHGMYEWLLDGRYRTADHWAFPRANLWPDADHRLAGALDGYPKMGTLWPDVQTRLSTKEKSGGRLRIHEGSPYGTGEVADVVLEHHKLIVRTPDERLAQARAYERLQEGAGSGHFLPYQAPELFADLYTVPYVEVALA